MKKSELYHLVEIAVVSSPVISPENKIEILQELFEQETLALYCEKREAE